MNKLNFKGITSAISKNTSGLGSIGVSFVDPLLYSAMYHNVFGVIPKDNLTQGKNAETIIMIPGFLLNQALMKGLGDRLSSGVNVIYPDIKAGDYLGLSLDIIADKIVDSVLKYEKNGKLQKNSKYTILGHSLGGVVAFLVSQKLQVKNILQIATPNKTPDVAQISGLGYIPAIFDLRRVEDIYAKIHETKIPLEWLINIVPIKDRFIGTHTQGESLIPSHIKIHNRQDIKVPGKHFSPLLTKVGRDKIAKVVLDILNQKQ